MSTIGLPQTVLQHYCVHADNNNETMQYSAVKVGAGRARLHTSGLYTQHQILWVKSYSSEPSKQFTGSPQVHPAQQVKQGGRQGVELSNQHHAPVQVIEQSTQGDSPDHDISTCLHIKHSTVAVFVVVVVKCFVCCCLGHDEGQCSRHFQSTYLRGYSCFDGFPVLNCLAEGGRRGGEEGGREKGRGGGREKGRGGGRRG